MVTVGATDCFVRYFRMHSVFCFTFCFFFIATLALFCFYKAASIVALLGCYYVIVIVFNWFVFLFGFDSRILRAFNMFCLYVYLGNCPKSL